MTSDRRPITFDSNAFQQHALDLVTQKLTGYGNQISEDHETALSGLCEAAALQLAGHLDKRIRFALPCGMGKTTAVRAILQTIHERDLPFRVVIASSKVEELCELKRMLISEEMIPATKIGLQHSYDYSSAGRLKDGYASEPAGNLEGQFLLVTHANVQSGGGRPWMKRCDLLLFDESLVVGEAHSLPLVRNKTLPCVRGDLWHLESRAAEADEHLAPAAATARALFDKLVAASEESSGDAACVVNAGLVDPSIIQQARRALASEPDAYPFVRQLFDWAERVTEFRVMGSAIDRTSLLTYSVSVPNWLRRVIVLDASDPIREVVHHDPRMERAEDVIPSLRRFRAVPGGLSSLKYHSAVEVSFACDAGSRSALTNSIRGSRSPWVIEKAVGLIMSKPGEPFLIFTHKPRDGECDIPTTLRRSLLKAGIDPDEMVPSGDPSEPLVNRVVVSTWGREAGTNEFSGYSNVVLLGVMQKPEEWAAGTYLGQVENLRCEKMKAVTRDLVASECRHSIYQAINRCRMRRVRVVEGVTQALPCSIYIWHHDKQLEAQLAPVLRGCPTWKPWREEVEKVKTTDAALHVKALLEEAEQEGLAKISCRELRKRLQDRRGIVVSDDMFTRARQEAVNETAWIKERSSLVRLFADADVLVGRA